MNSKSIYKTKAGQQAVISLYDAILADWPVPFETLTVSTRHGDTFAISCGNHLDKPLILLHGAGTNSLMWKSDVIEYSKHFHVYAVDLPGEPGKSTQARLDWSGPAFFEWLEDVLNSLRINRVSLIGFSQGGWAALKFSVRKPDHIEKLVLLSPGGIVPDKFSFVLKAVPLSMLGRWGIRRVNRLMSGDQEIPPDVDDALTTIMTHFNARVEPLPLFTDDELHQLQMPVLVIVGDKDALRDAPKIVARIRSQIPGSTAEVIRGGGQALMDTATKILPFLLKEIDNQKG